ncbi:hypothetical protein B0T24DRAFT_609006 [Lasiosphaeria ovina]|uniref:Secreted protein n=1 Tax=Lasiosphaeria ovina TaxID=92902 RepID=A0AAE0NN29_9PEZI|nr:hypothetical protein B0T24DRAFT_609006 [Lasiosphaeria ovina]
MVLWVIDCTWRCLVPWSFLWTAASQNDSSVLLKPIPAFWCNIRVRLFWPVQCSRPPMLQWLTLPPSLWRVTVEVGRVSSSRARRHTAHAYAV